MNKATIIGLTLAAALALGVYVVIQNVVFGDRDLQRLRKQIDNTISTKATDVSQCALMPLGAKPCGGPWEYLVYSKQSTDEGFLIELTSEYYTLDERLNADKTSDCLPAQKPSVTLNDGECIASQ